MFTYHQPVPSFASAGPFELETFVFPSTFVVVFACSTLVKIDMAIALTNTPERRKETLH